MEVDVNLHACRWPCGVFGGIFIVLLTSGEDDRSVDIVGLDGDVNGGNGSNTSNRKKAPQTKSVSGVGKRTNAAVTVDDECTL